MPGSCEGGSPGRPFSALALALRLDQFQPPPVENPKHAAQVMSAVQDQPCRDDDAIGALVPGYSVVFLVRIERSLRGPAEYGDQGPVAEHVDGVVPPLALGHAAAIDGQDLVEFKPVEGDHRCAPA